MLIKSLSIQGLKCDSGVTVSTKKQKNKSMIIAGVMTGTSCDGLDIAAVEFDGKSWTPLWEMSAPYPATLRKKVLAVQDPHFKGSLKSTYELNRDLGLWYGETIKKLISKAKPSQRPHVIANHGQTVGHYPQPGKKGYTVQMGDPSQVAALTGLTVVSHFRHGDLAMGGEGAPLATGFHRLIAEFLPHGKKGVAIHNLGGISNFTYFSPRGETFACDTGPANVFIDAATEKVTEGKLKFDRGGLLATQGGVDFKALVHMLRHPFLKKSLPKSTGRDDFTIPWFFSQTKNVAKKNLVPTATAFTVESIALTYEKFLSARRPLKAIYFTGGGTQNPVLMGWLSQRLKSVRIETLDAVGFDSRFIEAQAFSYLGFLSLLGHPVGGEWTGVKGFSPPGWITPGKNWIEVLNRLP